MTMNMLGSIIAMVVDRIGALLCTKNLAIMAHTEYLTWILCCICVLSSSGHPQGDPSLHVLLSLELSQPSKMTS